MEREDDQIEQYQLLDSTLVILTVSGRLQGRSAHSGHTLWTSSDATGSPLLRINQVLGSSSSLLASSAAEVVKYHVQTGVVLWKKDFGVDDILDLGVDPTSKAVFVIHNSGNKGQISQPLLFSSLNLETGEVHYLRKIQKSPEFVCIVEIGRTQLTPAVIFMDNKAEIYVHVFGSSRFLPIQVSAAFDKADAQLLRLKEDQPLTIAINLSNSKHSQQWTESRQLNLDTMSLSKPTIISNSELKHSIVTLAGSITSGQVFAVQIGLKAEQGQISIWDLKHQQKLSSSQVTLSTNPRARLQSISVEIFQNTENDSVIARAMVSTSYGDLAMWRAGAIDWLRDEGLAETRRILFVELLEPAALETINLTSDTTPLQSYLARLKHHYQLLIRLLGFLMGNSKHRSDVPERDHFGLRQLALAMNDQGRIWAIDTLSAAIMWSADVPAATTRLIDAHVSNEQNATTATSPILHLTYEAQDGEQVFEVAALYGNITISKSHDVASSKIPVHRLKVTATTIKCESSIAGEVISSWSFRVPKGDSLVTEAKSKVDKIASVGRVLGDRGVLYKYLKEDIVGLISVNHASRQLTLWILDVSSGKILHQATHKNVGTSKPIHLLMSENWVAYHFWSGDVVEAYQMVITELYEGPRNSRLLATTLANGDNAKLSAPHAISQSYIYDHEIRAMTATTSRHGITSRDILVSLATNQLTTISRRLLDPRRPDPKRVTAQDKEEMLVPYDPVLVSDPKSVLSHAREVAGTTSIVVAPTLLESTALVCAFGLDVFFTRVTPSMQFDVLSDSFSKSQIVVSIVALLLAILFTRPIARKKALDRRWTG